MRIAIVKPKIITNSDAIENNSNFVIYLIFDQSILPEVTSLDERKGTPFSLSL